LAAAASPADICYTGTWEIKSSNADNFCLSLHYPAGYSHWSRPVAVGSLGIADDDLHGPMHEVRFGIAREAGMFSCSGFISGGAANGTFRFHPNDAWAEAILSLGLQCSLKDQVVAAMADLPVSYVADVVKAGLWITSLRSLYAFRMKGLTSEEVGSLVRAFPDASIEDVILLAMSGATPQFINALRSAGVHDLTAANAVALRSVGVDQTFVDRAVAAGKIGLSVDELVRLRKTGL
jgi:hypothetical protein